MSSLAIVVGLWGHSCLPHLEACGEDVKQADFTVYMQTITAKLPVLC